MALRIPSLGVLALFTLVLASSGCGAGLVAGITANGGGNSAEQATPELSLTPMMPLVPAPSTRSSVVVTNAQIPAAATLRVTLTALSVEVDQPDPVISGRGGSTAIDFTLDTAPILAVVADPTAADVPATLSVLVDDEPIAAPVAVVLVRQPRAWLDLPSGLQQRFLSPFGEAVTLRVGGLQSIDAGSLQMLVETRLPGTPPGGGGSLIRVCTGLTAVPTGVSGEAFVTANVPGSSFPDRASLFVRDARSGQSTSAVVYYRPDITLALPSQGVTTGGNLVTLVGTALVPLDFSQTPAVLDFDAVDLSLSKGGRVTTLPREELREELSAGDRLVFRMPVAPDGRPGQVDIVLRVQLDGVEAEVVASQVFLFANPRPFFGPRGAVLDEEPVKVVPIELDAAPNSDDVPDFAVLTEQGGAGFVQLLLSQRNGMFQRFGAPRQIGSHESPAERNPRDLCTADFDGDSVPDLFLCNAGTTTAVHHVILGQARPLTPLGAVHRVAGAGGMARCVAAFVDGDSLADVVLVPGPGAPPGTLPQVLLARPTGVGQPAFAQPIDIAVRSFAYQAFSVEDLDGDGDVDFATVDGDTLQLDVALGNGDGTFAPANELDFSVPNYSADPGSTAIGLYGCGNGPLQSLALVLSGDDDGSGADPNPVVATLHQSSPGVFAAPVTGDELVMGTDPVGVSLVDDVYGNLSPELELIVGVRGDPSQTSLASIGVFRFSGTSFSPTGPGVQIGGELPRAFRSLHFGRAFPATPTPGEGLAVFAVHESEVDGARERRLSTLLVFDNSSFQPQLLTPDAGDARPQPVTGIVGGNWGERAVAGNGSTRDLAVARDGGVQVLENDGFGGIAPPGVDLVAPGLLAATLRLVPAPQGQVEALVFCNQQSRVGFWRPDTSQVTQSPDFLSVALRQLAVDPALQSATMASQSQVEVADVDGDGLEDLVVLVRFDLVAPGDGDALLVLLRGKAVSTPQEFPFYEPTVATPVHGRASAFALGDFAPTTGGPTRLELALAVPVASSPGAPDGDHVRFYHYVAGPFPDADRLVPSARAGGPQVLLAGSQPMRLAASDLDRDGVTDLLVAADGDDTLRLFRNVTAPTVSDAPVEVGAFVEALSSPRDLSPGTPTVLRLGDVNGDGALDALCAVERTLPGVGTKSTSVAFYLSEEPGVFADADFVSPTRLGNRDATLVLDLGDWNRDGVLDLFLGWNTAGSTDRNVRVLFGGSR